MEGYTYYLTCYLGNTAVEERYEQHSYVLPSNRLCHILYKLMWVLVNDTGTCIARNFCWVQIFTVFVDRLASVKIKTAKRKKKIGDIIMGICTN